MSDIKYYRATDAHIEALVAFRITFMESPAGAQAPEVIQELAGSLAGFFRYLLACRRW